MNFKSIATALFVVTLLPTCAFSKWVLTDPQVIDLKLNEDIFSEYHYELKKNVSIDPTLIKEKLNGDVNKARETLAAIKTEKCHTQGLSISEDNIVVSCCFYPVTYKALRTYASQSFLLRANFKDILEEQKSENVVSWDLKDVTEYVQEKVGDDRVTRVFGHPGGIAIDPVSQQVLMPLAVYDEKAKGRFGLFNPNNLKMKKQSVLINEHISIAGVLLNQFWLGSTWGSKQLMYVDSKQLKGQPKFEPAPAPFYDYQDCESWNDNTLLCGAKFASKVKEKDAEGKEVEWKISEGRLFFLEFSGKDLASLHLEKTTPVYIKSTGNEVSDVLGKRGYRYVEGSGDIEKFAMNQYGDYQSYLPLSNEGVALSPDKKYIYFMPDDIPGSKLVRYTLISDISQ